MTGQSNSASGMEELHRPGELCALITIQGRHLGVPETPQNWAEFRVMCACVFLIRCSFDKNEFHDIYCTFKFLVKLLTFSPKLQAIHF